MSRLNDLLRQVAKTDPQLAKDLRRETDALADRRAFGLNFERHTPEAVELPGRPVRKNDKVRILPERGKMPKKENERLYRVTKVYSEDGERWADVAAVDDAGNVWSVIVDDLVVVAEFRDPIYPGLVSTGKVERGGDKPFHTVINAENYHALQTLLFTHRGKVDCIYIDPPYNTGAKDWKYNNDYVESDDHYRHSKWLAMMERRLFLAKELLNPNDSILIVTIDEKEYLRLGLLIGQVFPESSTQMVTSVIAPSGQPRANQMSRVEEYLFITYIGDASVGREIVDENSAGGATERPVAWENLIRRGTSARRIDRPNQFYPLMIDTETRRIVGIGDALLPPSAARGDLAAPEGLSMVWPIRSDGTEGRWRISADAARRLLERGLLRLGRQNRSSGQWAVNYVLQSDVSRIESGEIRIDGYSEDGSAILVRTDVSASRRVVPKTVWSKDSHNAGNYGSSFLRQLLPGRSFPFPKSLYAVEDALGLFVGTKPEATIVDFFAGSGTTCHAVMRLNRRDGGRRRSILVTNNEVSADEQRTLRAHGHRPGDPTWESLGIYEYITKPRIERAVTGKTPAGDLLEGDYKFIDKFPISDGLEENVEFFTLTYESAMRLASNRDFTKIAPLLWLRAGSQGRRIDSVASGWDVAEKYGVIADLDLSEPFLKAVESQVGLTNAFIVTDEDRLFEALVRQLPEHVEPVRLYSSYLRNFEIEAGRTAR
ncbi:site-specific DNA-methyltransferase [Gordonia sp. 'Campus']|uniref:site-specific DNA-methyltransferase n=1 Tax=Gordonia sp. 'Campus' TaxID=2915824 RepID=UPI001EE47DFB|nr:DNA methyltransferase [Gordonia sp. 'Campus']